MDDGSYTQQQVWQRIQKWLGIESIQTFLWLSCKQRIPTNSYRKLCHLMGQDAYTRCGVCNETVLHMVRDFQDIIDMWTLVLNPKQWQGFFKVDVEEWMFQNLSTNLDREVGENQLMLFGFTYWLAWINQNLVVFERKTKTTQMVTLKARMSAEEILQTINFF